MDAFYASVEQRDNPELRGKPVAVGGAQARGVVAAASYEARKFGVHSAMPSVTAKRKCPDLIFVAPRFDVYKAISLQIREIFAEYTPIIEPLSLDEAYLDVTENLKGIASATRIAEEIRARIRAETGLTASAGVSYNKFLAKLASDHRKPDGLFVITPATGPEFVEDAAGQEIPRRRTGDGRQDGRGSASRPGSTSKRRPWRPCSSISARRVATTTGRRVASTNGPCAPTGSANRSAPRTPFRPISSPTRPRVTSFGRLSTRFGDIAKGPAFAAAPSRSRSSSRISGRSRAAAPARCRSATRGELEELGNELLAPIFPSPEAFGSSASRFRHLLRKGPNRIASSVCCSRTALLGTRFSHE